MSPPQVVHTERVSSSPVTTWHEGVGRLVHQAAIAESAVARLARQLGGVDEAAAAQLLPLELEQLVRVVRNLLPLRIHDVRLVNDVLDWTHQVRKLYAVRTSVVHTVWVAAEDTGEMVPAWSSADVAESPVAVADLERTTGRLAQLCGAPLHELLERTRTWTPSVASS